MWLAAAVLSLLLALTGCQTLQKINEAVNESPVLSYIAVQQAVARYIQSGDAQTRAQVVLSRASAIEAFVDGNPLASPGEVLQVFKDSVDMTKLSIADQLLVNDIIMFVEMGVKDAPPEEKPELIGVKDMLKTAKQTAQIFLGK